MPRESSNVVLLGGPNGAGKTTVSRAVLAEELGITEFVNADVLAQGLSGFAPDRVAFAAGRIMLERLAELAQARSSFAFETTLASRSFAPFIRRLRETGYRCHLVYVWLESPKLCVARVRARVKLGGHFVPDEIVARRYERSLANLFSLYLPVVDSWAVYNNSFAEGACLIAEHAFGGPECVARWEDWQRMKEIAHGTGQ